MGSYTFTYERLTTLQVEANKRKMENIPSKEKVKEAFEKKDKTGDGKLTFGEIKEIIEQFSSEDQQKDPTFGQTCKMVCNMADVNGDKMIAFAEIVPLMFGDSLEPENAMKGAFRAYDTNGDGYLNKKELVEVMTLSGLEADSKLMKMTMVMFDDNDDGRMNYDEFCSLIDGKVAHSLSGPPIITVKA